MKKRLQVFISSTYTDLIEERQAAVEAILDAGHIPAGMELFKAGDKSQLETIYKWIDECDIFMLILGGRYGSIEPKSGKSYIQLEYEYALSKNIPIFAVILSQNFLVNKIKSCGLANIIEQISPDKYQLFKLLVMSKMIREVNECKDIKLSVHTTINELLHEHNLIGWIRANSIFDECDLSYASYNNLYNLNKKIINEILTRYHSQSIKEEINSFSVMMSKQLRTILSSPYGVLNYSEILIKLDFTNKENHLIKVTITKIFDYSHLEYESHPYNIKIMATEYQAKTYKTTALIIDGKDYTSKIKLNINRDPYRKQFCYNIYSNQIPLQNSQCKITHISSYECYAIDFFFSHRLNCLCKDFKAHIILSEEVREIYTLVTSTFSPFSELHYDDFKAKELISINDEIITLPIWSLPGSGYATTLKYKSNNNHL